MRLFKVQHAYVCNGCLMLAVGGRREAKKAIRNWMVPPSIDPLHPNDLKRGYRQVCDYCGSDDNNTLYRCELTGQKKGKAA